MSSITIIARRSTVEQQKSCVWTGFWPGGPHQERPKPVNCAPGSSYPIGAPQFTRATLAADVFAEQPIVRGESTILGTEVGLRYQLTPGIVWDVGLGTEFAGPADRSSFFATTGLSFGF